MVHESGFPFIYMFTVIRTEELDDLHEDRNKVIGHQFDLRETHLNLYHSQPSMP